MLLRFDGRHDDVRWRDALGKGDLPSFARDGLRQSARRALEAGFPHIVGDVRPVTMPSFLASVMSETLQVRRTQGTGSATSIACGAETATRGDLETWVQLGSKTAAQGDAQAEALVKKSRRAAVVPAAFTLELPDDPPPPRTRPFKETVSPAWRESLPPAQSTPAKRFTKTQRIVIIAAGAAGGFYAGAAIGYAATSKSNDADDVSGLRGVVIGAPIGAAVGALIGWQLTK